MKWISLFLTVLFMSCSTVRYVPTPHIEAEIIYPALQDSSDLIIKGSPYLEGYGDWNWDYWGGKINNGDTIWSVKVDTIIKKVYIKIKADTIKIPDSLLIYKFTSDTIKITPTITEKLGYGMIGVIGLTVILIIIWLIFRRK